METIFCNEIEQFACAYADAICATLQKKQKIRKYHLTSKTKRSKLNIVRKS